uniref:Uncharacterized protein n=1 Tax=Candidatus Methanophagaceae archaeon ANME-1 ERB6 TaxID=2759912 RepID=A0A7G9YWK1_9EURY|nr:hypothetical protein IAKEDICC_00005 [Methanosarcinales archaeon ANME-1 ERB6]
MGLKENYEINQPDLHKIAEQQIKGKGDFTKSIIENRMRTQKIIEDQGISVLAVFLAEVLNGILEQKELDEKIKAVLR